MKPINLSAVPLRTWIFLPAFLWVSSLAPLFAKSDNGNEGNGNGQAQAEHGNSGSTHGQASGSSHENSRRGEAVSVLARAHIHSSHYKHPGGVYADALNGGQLDTKYAGTGNRPLHGNGRSGQNLGADSAVKNFESLLEKMRAKHPDMLDPYGLVKDNRKELYGNRGRVLHGEVVEPPPDEEPPTEEPPPPDPDPVPEPEPEPTSITITVETVYAIELMVWNGEAVTRQILSDLGYTETQIDYLITMSVTDLRTALSSGGTLTFP